MVVIYGLYDKVGALRYIGKANDPVARLKSHMRDARRRQTPLYNWITKHGKPEMRVLEADCVDWKDAERRLIRDARERGDRLLNLADGGDEPFCSVEARRSNAARLNAFHKEDALARWIWLAKRNIAHGLRHNLVPEEVKAKLRLSAAKCPELFSCWAHI